MSTIETKTFDTLVQEEVAAVQGASSSLADLSVGSLFRSLVEAFCGVVLWIQGIALKIASLTRFASSSGEDADSWAADYGFTRLPAVAATGEVTFSRFTATSQAAIPVGTLVETADGSQQFAVMADTTQVAYDAASGSYLIAAGTMNCDASVQAVVPGATGNSSAGSVTVLTSAVPYVDTVTNALAFTNGEDEEPDTSFRVRFVAWVASLSKATPAAIKNAVYNLQRGMAYELVENELYDGTSRRGYFYVVVDDGSGSPSSTVLASVANAIDAVRPVGGDFGVFSPVVVSANVSMILTTASGYTHADIVSEVTAALSSFINTLPLGTALAYSRLAQVAHDASAGVLSATGVTLNGGTADLAATAKQVIKAGTLTIS